MRILAIGILLFVIFGVGFCVGVIYNAYVEPEEETLNVQLYNNLLGVTIRFENMSWVFDGNPLDYNLTGDPEEDNAFQLHFCNLTVIEEEPIYIVIITKLSVLKPYEITNFDEYYPIVVFKDYTTKISHKGRTGFYFYAFYKLHLIE